MSNFSKNVKKFKNYDKNDVNTYFSCVSTNKLLERDKSFNYNHSSINENTKVIIVGTYTPKNGRDNGYYYSSQKNEM